MTQGKIAHTSELVPVRIWRFPICIQGGRQSMGTPCTHNEIVCIWGSTYTPSDLDKTNSLEGIFIQILDDALFLIIEDKVVGDESFDNHFNRWISVMIN